MTGPSHVFYLDRVGCHAKRLMNDIQVKQHYKSIHGDPYYKQHRRVVILFVNSDVSPNILNQNLHI